MYLRRNFSTCSFYLKKNKRSIVIANFLHKGDIPSDVTFSGDIAVDTETKGLNIALRDRLCVVQLSDGNGDAHLVQFTSSDYNAPNLKKILSDNNSVKIFHYARFDVAVIKHYLGVSIENIYCTKIASRIARTYTDKHGLKELVKELVGIDLSKQQQCSNWGSDSLSKEQIKYAAADVIYLHQIRDELNTILKAEGRMELTQKCFSFIPIRAELDLKGWADIDIFIH